ncbi:MAG: bifunctional precorrin-2 dehydrogenase/sirohydrochlorin ferrochelatase [Coriobacteriia bacterium]|nr:bifunctional precorrin-2 dehydrogenase/sirohydrochlorin ferrochelatase [Coriobacteriia bacterium]
MNNEPKRYFPVFCDLEGRRVVVVGESPLIDKRIRQLMRYGADVVVISSRPSRGLRDAAALGNVRLIGRTYEHGDLDDAFLVLCMSNDERLSKKVFKDAEELGCLANAGKTPDLRNYLLPSVIHREPLQVAISTGGIAPEAAKILRQHLEPALGVEWAKWINLLAEVRAEPRPKDDKPGMLEREIDIVLSEQTRERISFGERLSARTIQGQAKIEGLRAEMLAKAEETLSEHAAMMAAQEAEAEAEAEAAATQGEGEEEAGPASGTG